MELWGSCIVGGKYSFQPDNGEHKNQVTVIQGEKDMEENQELMALYDVRGIQDYIFRTTKVKDAMGASRCVENLLMEALKQAVKDYNEENKTKQISCDAIKWKDEEKELPFLMKWKPMQVLYEGGGNAYVLYESRELYLYMNKKISRYILNNTYSLQLSVACVEKTKNYLLDYMNLNQEMARVKARQIQSKPYGALPIMQTELDTGFPMANPIEWDGKTLGGSTETQQKKKHKNWDEDKDDKIFDNLIQKKGIDSTLAVVHLDGNNMGMRIQQYLSKETDYVKAVNRMRQISFQINQSYKMVFEKMYQKFDSGDTSLLIKGKEKDCFIRKIIIAGDDITYVCNGYLALATVEFFIREIENCHIIRNDTKNPGDAESAFRVCAGIAYMGSHFPFHVAYDTAEECCKSAKERAKKLENQWNNMAGSFVDFQICRNIFSRDLERARKEEYTTWMGESLIRRPYFVETRKNKEIFREAVKKHSFQQFKKAVDYFQNEENIPRRFAKEIQDTYAMGEEQMAPLGAFLSSRKIQLPFDEKDAKDKRSHFFDEQGAKWYDALEMMDLYLDLDRDICREERTNEQISNKNNTSE